jgi:Global regulator protein family
MMFDLSPGDIVSIGDSVILTVLAVNDGQVRFRLESPKESQSADMDYESSQGFSVPRFNGATHTPHSPRIAR